MEVIYRKSESLSLLSSCVATTSLLPRHVHQFSLADLQHHRSIHLHRDQIRDIKFSVEGGNVSYILSTGFDKTLKVKERMKGTVLRGWLDASSRYSSTHVRLNVSQVFLQTSHVFVFEQKQAPLFTYRYHLSTPKLPGEEGTTAHVIDVTSTSPNVGPSHACRVRFFGT